MNAMNQIIIEGNVVRDSTVRETSHGKVANMAIASNRYYKDSNGDFQSEVSFFDVQAWGRNFCESIAKNAVKGRGVRVVGRLKQDRWKSEDGKNFAKIYILADHIDFKPAPKETANSPQADKAELQNLAEANSALESETEEDYEKEAIAEAVF